MSYDSQRYVFVTDHFDMSVKAYNISDNMKKVKEIKLQALALPYDIMVYDGSVQEEGPGKVE